MAKGPYRRTWREWWRLHWWRVLFGAALTVAVTATVVTLAVVTQGAIFPIIGAWVVANATSLSVGAGLCGLVAGVAAMFWGCCGRRSAKVAAAPDSVLSPPTEQKTVRRPRAVPVTPARELFQQGAPRGSAAAAAGADFVTPPVRRLSEFMRPESRLRSQPAGRQRSLSLGSPLFRYNVTGHPVTPGSEADSEDSGWGPSPERPLEYGEGAAIKLVCRGERSAAGIMALVNYSGESSRKSYSWWGSSKRYMVYKAVYELLSANFVTPRVFAGRCYDGIPNPAVADVRGRNEYMGALQRRMHVLSALHMVIAREPGWEWVAHRFDPGVDMSMFIGGLPEVLARVVQRYEKLSAK